MTPERYEQVFQICNDALQVEADKRAAFLDRACDGNASLRREVEALLANEGRAESFLNAPALAVAAELAAEGLIWEKTTLPSNDRQSNDAYSSPPETRVEPFAPGLILDGRYVIEKELEQGGIGVVYLAHDRKLRNRVVIKTLMERTRAKSERKWIEEKFRQEIEVMARINHPGVVGALDVGALPDGRTYLVMQYIPGPSLRAAMDTGQMDLARVGGLIRQLGQALAAVHERNVIHRDLKPENIMLQQSGGAEYAKIIDFGIAKVRAELSVTDEQNTISVGTPAYMAPEQLRGRPVTASDVYALGVIAYEMLTGRRPFATDNLLELAQRQREGDLPKPRRLRPELPAAAEAVILRALAFDPRHRYYNAREFGDDLARALTVEEEKSQPPELELAHVLFTDLVGYSRLPIDEQTRLLQQLQEVVSATPSFRQAQESRRLLHLPTGDGMALVFFDNPLAPAQCAVEIARTLKSRSGIELRMGVHTGPVRRLADINQNLNIAGGGVNMAQRVMDCGEAGHIMLSKTVADTLSRLSEWADYLQDWGEQTVKHGVKLHLFNLYTGEAGNPTPPEKLRSQRAKPSQSAAPNPLWLILSILFLALTVGLAAVIARRFLGDAPDITGISITLSLGLLCLLVGSAFTRNGRQWVEHGFFRFGLKLTFQGKWQMAFTLAGALIVSAFYFSLPTIARVYNQRAIEFQQAGDLSTALKSYERAVSLNPGYAVAHYNLASAYEDVEAFDEALAEYQTAIRADPKFYFAHNNLARLYLLRRKDHASALNILNSALDLRPKEAQVKYSLYKNRGWAHLGLGYYDLAVADLRESLNWRQDGAAAHCLMAQALEAQRKEAAARPEWEACLGYAAGEADVEASWLSLARKRLEQGEQK
jgi:serine/threonine protein kinase/tetratricopeptide (TPR) repeat protein